MKIITRVIVLLLCIFAVTSVMRKAPIKNTDNHNSFRRTNPLSKLGRTKALTRVYRSIHSVFPDQRRTFRNTPNAVRIGKRNCQKICRDRMTVGCKSFKARANQYGVLECICVQKDRSKTRVFPQGDVCFARSGCIERNMDEECPFRN